ESPGRPGDRRIRRVHSRSEPVILNTVSAELDSSEAWRSQAVDVLFDICVTAAVHCRCAWRCGTASAALAAPSARTKGRIDTNRSFIVSIDHTPWGRPVACPTPYSSRTVAL